MGMPTADNPLGLRLPRQDGLLNRERVLDAAAVVLKEDGVRVPMRAIAREAGVGIATVYRHFPDRERLVGALIARRHDAVLGCALAAARSPATGCEAIAAFFAGVVDRSDDFAIPFHGDTPQRDERTVRVLGLIRQVVAEMVQRGKDDGTVRADVTEDDILRFAATLAQPQQQADDSRAAARRHARFYADGLAAVAARTRSTIASGASSGR